MKQRLARTAVAPVAMILCAAGGLFISELWQGRNTRDFLLRLAMMAALILVVAIVLRRTFHWHVLDFVFGLVVTEFLTLFVISYFNSGDLGGFTWFDLFDWFNLQWLARMSLFIGLPWFSGFALGSLWLRFSEERKGAGKDFGTE